MPNPVLDARLPPLLEIHEPTRQQVRRITRRTTLCPRCRKPLTADDLCFAAGHDHHRSCAEMWNAQITSVHEELLAQDAAQAEDEAWTTSEPVTTP